MYEFFPDTNITIKELANTIGRYRRFFFYHYCIINEDSFRIKTLPNALMLISKKGFISEEVLDLLSKLGTVFTVKQ